MTRRRGCRWPAIEGSMGMDDQKIKDIDPILPAWRERLEGCAR
jgi:hypothetical protein